MTTAVLVGRATAGASASAVAAGPTHLIRARSTNPGNVVISRNQPDGVIDRLFPVVEVHEFTDRVGDRTALVVCENGTFAFSPGMVIEVAGPRPSRVRRGQR
jgi:hypothetical protein